MTALVLKTNQLVEIVDKKGEYYIDKESNPYKKAELEFFLPKLKHKHIVDDENDEDEQNEGFMQFLQIPSFGEWSQRNEEAALRQAYIEYSVQLACCIIESHPNFTSGQVANFTTDIIQSIISQNQPN